MIRVPVTDDHVVERAEVDVQRRCVVPQDVPGHAGIEHRAVAVASPLDVYVQCNAVLADRATSLRVEVIRQPGARDVWSVR